MHCCAGAGDFSQDVVGLGGPDERFWVQVVAVDVISDGHDELFEVAEYSTADAFFGQIAEETLDHVQPRGRGRREVHVEALVPG